MSSTHPWSPLTDLRARREALSQGHRDASFTELVQTTMRVDAAVVLAPATAVAAVQGLAVALRADVGHVDPLPSGAPVYAWCRSASKLKLVWHLLLLLPRLQVQRWLPRSLQLRHARRSGGGCLQEAGP